MGQQKLPGEMTSQLSSERFLYIGWWKGDDEALILEAFEVLHLHHLGGSLVFLGRWCF